MVWHRVRIYIRRSAQKSDALHAELGGRPFGQPLDPSARCARLPHLSETFDVAPMESQIY